jgi:hypothetical protein
VSARGETVGWLVGLPGAGTGVLFVASATAPTGSAGDWWDSALFFPLTLAVGGLAGVPDTALPAVGSSSASPRWRSTMRRNSGGIQETLRGTDKGYGQWGSSS